MVSRNAERLRVIGDAVVADIANDTPGHDVLWLVARVRQLEGALRELRSAGIPGAGELRDLVTSALDNDPLE